MYVVSKNIIVLKKVYRNKSSPINILPLDICFYYIIIM